MDKKQCHGCLFWESLSGFPTGDKGCTQILYTKKMRVEKDGKCLSRVEAPVKETKSKRKQRENPKNMV